MKKYRMNLNTEFIGKIAEFDRNDPEQKLDTWGYTSDNTIDKIVDDIESGIGIQKPIEVVVVNGKALMVQGCHRLAAAKKSGLKELPAIVMFLKRMTAKFKSIEHKLKDI